MPTELLRNGAKICRRNSIVRFLEDDFTTFDILEFFVQKRAPRNVLAEKSRPTEKYVRSHLPLLLCALPALRLHVCRFLLTRHSEEMHAWENGAVQKNKQF
jgi:hypothetical protein